MRGRHRQLGCRLISDQLNQLTLAGIVAHRKLGPAEGQQEVHGQFFAEDVHIRLNMGGWPARIAHADPVNLSVWLPQTSFPAQASRANNSQK